MDEEELEKKIRLDTIINELGSWGKYQKSRYAIIMVPIMFSVICKMQYVFVAGELEYRCKVPECEKFPFRYKTGNWVSFALPPDETKRKCHRLKPIGNACTRESFSKKIVKCNEWVYEKDDTVVHTYNLACDELKRTAIGCMCGLGIFLGVILSSNISDRFGRKIAFIFTATNNGIFSLIRSFSQNYDTHMVLEFANSLFGSGVYSSGFILCMEMVHVKHRVISGSILSCAYAIGQCLLAGLAYFVRYWRHLLRFIAAPGLCFILYIFIINESVRWLLSHEKNLKALSIIKRIAKVNKVTFTPETQKMLDEFEHYQSNASINSKDPKEAFVMLRKSKILMIRMIICGFWWTTVSFLYYGLSVNAVSLVGNKYLNYLLLALVEYPGYYLTVLGFNNVGRNKSMMAAFTICGILLGLMAIIPKNHWFTIVLVMVSKMLISMAFNGVYVYTVELFPTRVRHRTMGICSMLGRMGTSMAPLTPAMVFFWPPLPYVVFSIFGFISSGIAVLIPETLNKRLPETITEAEQLGTAPRIN